MITFVTDFFDEEWFRRAAEQVAAISDEGTTQYYEGIPSPRCPACHQFVDSASIMVAADPEPVFADSKGPQGGSVASQMYIVCADGCQYDVRAAGEMLEIRVSTTDMGMFKASVSLVPAEGDILFIARGND